MKKKALPPLPVWKRDHYVVPPVVKSGANCEKHYTNSLGTAVTDALCKDVLYNTHPKNLTDAVKLKHPVHLFDAKPSDKFFETGEVRPEELQRRIHALYHGAIEMRPLRRALRSVLDEEGLNYSNVVHIVCRAPEDHSRIFHGDFLFPGESFNFGGICGLPFGGPAALAAAFDRVPDGGTMLIEVATHMGYDDQGELGTIRRFDQHTGLESRPLRAIWPAMMAYEMLVKAPRSSLDSHHTGNILTGSQMQGVFQLVAEHFQEISESDNVLVFMSNLLHKVTLSRIYAMIAGCAKARQVQVIIVGGIYIELPDGLEDFFLPLSVQSRSLKGAIRDMRQQLQFHLERPHLQQNI
eukprot:g2763.t1